MKRTRSDAALARGLLENAEEDFRIISEGRITAGNASFFFKAAYDCRRSALQSFLARDGLKPYSHEAIIQYAQEQGFLDRRSALRTDRYRLLRHDIEYRAARATSAETDGLIRFVRRTLPRIRRLL